MRKWLALVLCWPSFALAQVTPNSWINPQVMSEGAVAFTSANTPGNYSLFAAANWNGTKCFGVMASNSDSAAHVLTLQLVNGASFTAGIAAQTASFTASIAVGPSLTGPPVVGPGPYGIMTVTAVSSGLIVPGMLFTGTGVPTGTSVIPGPNFQLSGTANGVGVYYVTSNTTVSSFANGAGTYGLMTVSALAAGSAGGILFKQIVNGAGVTAGTYITGYGTGIGGVGTYFVNSNTVVAGGTTLTTSAPMPQPGLVPLTGLLTGAGAKYGAISVTVPAGAGFTANPVSVLGLGLGSLGIDAYGNVYEQLPAGWHIDATYTVAVGATFTLSAAGACSDL